MSRSRGALLLVTAVGALLIFANLDNRYLWDDEAETALLAQRVLRFGVPIAWDGRDLISQECGADYDTNYLWRQTPWLPVYVTAVSFRLFGESTWTARFPFAALGVLSIVSLYVVALSLLRDRALALLSAVVLVLTVPFLLHVRQDRYYSVAVFAAIWVLYCFFGLLRDRPGALLGLTLAMTVLFHSNYLVAFATAAGLGLAFFAFPFSARVALRLAGAVAATLVINLPWLGVFDVRGKTGATLTTLTGGLYLSNLWLYLAQIELYAFPVVLLAALVTMRFVLTSARPWEGWPAPRVCLALVLFSLGHLVFVSAAPTTFFRYIVTLLPAFVLLQAVVVRTLWSANRLAAVAGCALLLLVDRADLVQGTIGSTPLKYVHEITHDVPGPIAGIVRHLRGAARPGERLFISYGDLPLRFYTDLEVRGGQGCQSLVGWPLPDWIIRRHFFRFRPNSPGAEEDEERTIRYLRTEVPVGRYRESRLPVVDTIWENIPEPALHVYREPREGPRVTINRKVAP
ncbi:MAG: glycosyltransferase family 39 protein [Actinobacteria bacterium]|nr:glycosyltransferase family 39 protein [Actinomycetota bacterium]